MATCTLTLGDDTHKFPLQPGGASTSTILAQARTGFAIPRAKVSISAGAKTASRAREKCSIDEGAVGMAAGRMDHHVSGLVDHDQVWIAVQQGDGQVLGDQLTGRRCRPG